MKHQQQPQRSAPMTVQSLLSSRGSITQATKDIHERCKAEIDLLWDDGRSHGDSAMHKVKVWNGLGSLYRLVSDRDLMERGDAYQRFLDELAEAVNRSLTVP
jgi:hypothetical protein